MPLTSRHRFIAQNLNAPFRWAAFKQSHKPFRPATSFCWLYFVCNLHWAYYYCWNITTKITVVTPLTSRWHSSRSSKPSWPVHTEIQT